ncbi:MAG: alpha/beta hydrolase [Myxococcales bacterium]|nr:alpha/beta hydrolase [Myxococcales bacterium]
MATDYDSIEDQIERGHWETLRRRFGGAVMKVTLDRLSRAGQYHPRSLWSRRGIDVVRDVRYHPGSHRAHLLDIYRPATPNTERLPALLYIHGGAFRILSKETHWMMGLMFAKQGFVVFNINYRLAPKHPYPAALVDVCHAYKWVERNAQSYGADPTRIVVAGESAGGNLATALTLLTSYRRPEPWARSMYEESVQPHAAIVACAVLQVSDSYRFSRTKPIPSFLADRLRDVEEAYFPSHIRVGREPTLADPLLLIESRSPDRLIPPMFAFVGTKDPLLDDTRRLKVAMDRHQPGCEIRIYAGGVHAFHAVYWTTLAKQCWHDQFVFLDTVLGTKK